ncbi:hypothetical protein CEP51_016457 [Fusarium floridanum]|uniref:AAA+ ATPase domain-containing protein n=1 Tax=Fusarium floridanum TaxID=1325733 RepID=A0A428NPH0_9HYPO|nr:hypothetical protein CEP51_016457 [Fusarium floridanum]
MGKELPDLPIDTEWAPGWPAISSSQHDEDDLDSEDVQVGAIDLESALANESDDTGNDDESRSDSHSDKTDDDGDDDDEDEANGSYKNLVSEYLRHVYDSSSEGHTADNRASPYPEEQRTPCNWQTWQHLRHYTISKDQTRASASESAKLTAVRQSSYTSAPVVAASNVKQPNASEKKVDLPDYQMQMMLLEQQNKKRLMMARQEQDKEQQEVLAMDSQEPDYQVVPSLPTGGTRDHPGKGKELSNAAQIAVLEEQIQTLRRQQNSLKSTTLLVLHKIQDQRSTYLAEPYWTLSDRRELRLVGNSPLADEEEYLLQRPDVAFVVYKHYEHTHQVKAIQTAKAEGSVLPDPEPARETIQLLSKKMIWAMDAFVDTQSTFKTYFPDWHSEKPIESPFLFWYYYRSLDRLDVLPEASKSQMRLLTGWIDDNYSGIYTNAKSEFDHGLVCQSTMPFFIQPGEALISKNDDGIQGYIAESWPTKVSTTRHHSSPSQREPHKVSQRWAVQAWCYRYDGGFYRRNISLYITLDPSEDEGKVDIAKLQVLPLRLEGGNARVKLDRRGRLLWACRHRKLIEYKDEAEDDSSREGERYMVDFETYRKLHSDSVNFQKAYPTLNKSDREEIDAAVMECDDPPREPELFVFPSKTVGYNLRQKKWRDLDVDSMQDVSWNKQAFAHLVVPDETKDLIRALISNRLKTEEKTDLIQGKGNGLIMLLHGGPGTGKTFTAESVAELAEKPLFRVTCGDIGTQPEAVEEYLESVLHLGKIWGCVVLLDEADVFLEQRSLFDLERNALVSVFLRVLEYYEGILILTSNRVGTFDEAFKSRIQLSLHYETLDKPQRRKIWENFLERLQTLESDSDKIEAIQERKRKYEGVDFEDIRRHLGDLAQLEMNGRQIRNSITTARQLARFKGDSMRYRHLEHVITVSKKFDSYLQRVRENCIDDQVVR